MKQIPLTQGLYALVDAADYELLAKYSWHAKPDRNTVYARTRIPGGGPRMLMHRLLTGAQSGQLVDHINGNGLDNRRANLRLCTAAENIRNKQRKLNRVAQT